MTWWNSNASPHKAAAQIDFTNAGAAEWFNRRLRRLQAETGIDSFKFDAGEVSWQPKDSRLNASIGLHPLASTAEYVKAVSEFGRSVEVRSGFGTQSLPIFMRMFDKDSIWGHDNGLASLVTTLLQLNMVGYAFVMPDMIGGNGYNRPPDKELFIRWLQANVFMPNIQFSYVPWDYDAETIAISRDMVQLHLNISHHIVSAAKEAVLHGKPVNRPIWWLDPNDKTAQAIDDGK